jgi:hydroxymethylbilane synthase
LDFQVITVRTHGDADTTTPLAGMGLGVFVKEIEQQLLAGQLDMAVHSLKDMPTKLPEGLDIGAVLRRQDPRDVLVNKWGYPLSQLPSGARIGTSSPRRVAQLKNCCPQVEVLSIRGNVETRLRKAQGEDYDGAILAAAGLIRLGLAQHITEYLSTQQFVPPPGQGVLAVEVRADDDRMLELLHPIENAPTRYAVTAERAFLEILGGGCQVPVGAYARSEGEMLVLTVFIGALDGKKAFRAKLEGLTHDPRQLASDAYQTLIEQGGGELM